MKYTNVLPSNCYQTMAASYPYTTFPVKIRLTSGNCVAPPKLWLSAVTPKSVPPKNRSGRTDFVRNLVPRTTFAPDRILAAKLVPPCQNLFPGHWPRHGPILAKVYLPKLVPPQEVQLFVYVDGCMDIASATSQLSQNLPVYSPLGTLVLPDLSSLY